MGAVTLNRAGLDHLYISPVGPVMQHLYRKGQTVLGMAQQTCPVHLGELRQSLKVAITSHGVGNKVEIGSDHKELLFVEQGTGPAHQPNPNPPYFPPWNKPEFAVWATGHGLSPYQLALHISIHGTQPQPFMEAALRSVF